MLVVSADNALQIHEEARKFSYQTGVKVVVAYGGAPINHQVLICEILVLGLLICFYISCLLPLKVVHYFVIILYQFFPLSVCGLR